LSNQLASNPMFIKTVLKGSH